MKAVGKPSKKGRIHYKARVCAEFKDYIDLTEKNTDSICIVTALTVTKNVIRICIFAQKEDLN